MAHHFREPERRQPLLLPADMRDWLPQGDIVHLIVDAVAMMDLSEFEASAKLGRAGQAPFAPQVLLALLVVVCAYLVLPLYLAIAMAVNKLYTSSTITM